VKHGADINKEDKYGATPLFILPVKKDTKI